MVSGIFIRKATFGTQRTYYDRIHYLFKLHFENHARDLPYLLQELQHRC